MERDRSGPSFQRRGASDPGRDISFTVTRPCGPREIASPADISRLDLGLLRRASRLDSGLYMDTNELTRGFSASYSNRFELRIERGICTCCKLKFENYLEIGLSCMMMNE